MAAQTYPINPIKTIANAPFAIATFARICIFVAALVTSYGFYLMVVGKCQELGFSFWPTQISGIALALLSAKITDFGIISIMEYVLFYGIGLPIRGRQTKQMPDGYEISYWSYWSTDKYKHYILTPIIWLLMVALGAGAFYVDRISADIASNTIAQQAPKKAKRDIAALRGELDAKEKSELKGINADINNTKAEIKAAERRVEQREKGLKKLIRDGNTWAPKQLESLKASASAKARQRLETLENEKLNRTTASGAANAAVINAELAENSHKDEQNARLESLTSVTAYAFGWWAKLGGLIAYTVLIIMMFTQGRNLDVNNDGSIDLADLHAYAGVKKRGFGFF